MHSSLWHIADPFPNRKQTDFFPPEQYNIPTFLPVGHKLLTFNIITHPSNVTSWRTRCL